MNTNYTIAKLNAASTAPKGQPHDRQHYDAVYGPECVTLTIRAEIELTDEVPATRWADWDEALKLRNEVRR
jgi:hypothetical protein